MEVFDPQCAGLVVHKDTGVACVRIARGATVTRELREFGTTTRPLVALREWVAGHGVTPVAMESTGVYWKPVWHVREGQFTLVPAMPRRSWSSRTIRPVRGAGLER